MNQTESGYYIYAIYV